MFGAIMGAIRRWRNPPTVLIVGPGIVPDNHELAQRVFKRLRAVDDSNGPALDDPLGFMLGIAHEEVMIDIKLAMAQERVRMLELIHILPPRQRALLLDHIERDMDVKQLARKHGLTHKIVLRDLAKAYAAVRMRREDGRANTVDDAGPLPTGAGEGNAGVRPAAPVVGGAGAVHNDRPPDRGLSVPCVEQQPDSGSEES